MKIIQDIQGIDIENMTDDKRLEIAERMPVEFGELVYKTYRLGIDHSYNIFDYAPFADGSNQIQKARDNIERYLAMRAGVYFEVRTIGGEAIAIRRPERRQKLRYRPNGGILRPSGIENFLFQKDIQRELGHLQRRILKTRGMSRDETIFGRVTIVEKAYIQKLAELLGLTVSNFVRGQTIVYNTFQPDIMHAQESLMGRNSPGFELLTERYHTHILHALRILLREIRSHQYIKESTRTRLIDLSDKFIDEVHQAYEHTPNGPELPFAA